MGGIGLSSTDPNRTPHAHTHTEHRYQDTHIRTYTCKHIYAHRHKQNNMQHTICTQFAHNPHTHKTQTNIYTCKEYRYTHRNRTHNTEYTEQTENKHTSTHLYAQLFTYIVLIFIAYDNISKNSIIQLYTKLIHFGHLINKVSKITIILIH